MGSQSQTANANLDMAKVLLDVYHEVCTNIRTSDDISFKLLGLVPLISGSGAAILSLNKIWAQTGSIPILLISMVAALITFGLFKWEMRNVQRCSWLIARAAALESSYFHVETEGKKHVISQFYGSSFQESPPLLGKIPDFQTVTEGQQSKKQNNKAKGVGKEQAERIIYWTSIGAWLIPIGIAALRLKGWPGI
jgi:hypothetical protein